MAVDFQVIFPQEVVPINQVRNVPGLPVRTLDIIGDDFRSVDEVLINDVASPDIAILSQTRLLAQVPDTLQYANLTSVTVLNRKIILTNRSLIRFRIGETPGKVRGIMRLMQLFLKILFTTPGSDIFSPKIGGAGLRAIGSNFGRDDGGDIVSNFIVSVDQARTQIIQIQGRNSALPPDERLLAANVPQAGFNASETALIATVELLSQAGNAATARLEL